MSATSTFPKRVHGFSLLEILIAVVVLSVGLLGVARFQSGLIATSSSNKARVEAMALAQQKIDELRSYSTEAELISKLSNAAVTSGDFPAAPSGSSYEDHDLDSNPIVGTNADFGRSWSLSDDGKAKKVSVEVTWEDAKTGEEESVSLSTVVTWTNPELVANLATSDEDFTPLVEKPAGQAEYSELTYDVSGGPLGTPNDDGTYLYAPPETTNVVLLDELGNVLLILKNACNTSDGNLEECTIFATIKGRVYLDQDTDGDPADYDDLFVGASDATYCSKGDEVNLDVSPDFEPYSYFDYTCYMGGAWFGNLGVIQSIAGSEDLNKVCIGDPRSSDHTNPSVQATRRIYRGMLSVDYSTSTDLSGDAIDDLSDGIADDSNGLPRYISIGIHDQMTLSHENDTNVNEYYSSTDEAYLPGHNFLVTAEQSDNLSSDDCTTRLEDVPDITITDTATSDPVIVHPFYNTPDDFFCLNQIATYTDASGNTRYQEYYDDNNEKAPHYDNTTTPSTWTNTSSGYDIPHTTDASGNVTLTGCPFNPADPPTELVTVKGSLYFTDATSVPETGMVVNTSDDVSAGTPGNCTVTIRSAVGAATADDATPDAGVFADYSCDIYHSYDDRGTATPDDDEGAWEGTVLITPSDYFSCSPDVYSFSGSSEWITEDTGTQTGEANTTDPTGLDFNCSFIGIDGADLVTVKSFLTDVTPNGGSFAVIRNRVTNNGPEDATSVVVVDPVPAGMTYLAQFVTPGTTYNQNTGVWEIGDVAIGEIKDLFWAARIDVGQVGNEITSQIMSVTADQDDPTDQGDVLSDSVIVTSTTTANLIYQVSLVFSNPNPAVGDFVIYAVDVTNIGDAAAGLVSLTNTVPAGLTAHPAFPTYGLPQSTSITGTPTIWSAPTWSIGTLLRDETARLYIIGRVAAGQEGNTLTNTITIPPRADDPSTINDVLSASVSVMSNNSADLVTYISINNAAPAVGDTLTYTVTIWYLNGNAASADNITTTVDLNTINEINGLTLLTSGANAPVVSQGTFNALTGVWSGISLSRFQAATLTLKVDVDSGADALSQPITVSTTNATGNVTDPVPTGDGILSADINVIAAGTTRTVTGSISYNDYTTDFVTGVTIYSVDTSLATPGTAGTCSLSGTGAAGGGDHAYTCNVEYDPNDDGGVYLQFAYARTICDYNARSNSGVLDTSGADQLLWLVPPIGVATNYPIIARDETGARPSCP